MLGRQGGDVPKARVLAMRDNQFVKRLWRSVKYEEVSLHAYDSASAVCDGIGCAPGQAKYRHETCCRIAERTNAGRGPTDPGGRAVRTSRATSLPPLKPLT